MLDIESKLNDISVFDFVFLALDTVFAGVAGGGFGAEGGEVVVVDHFGSDEAALEVGVDDAGGSGGFVAGADGPGACFLLAGGEIGAEAEEVIDAFDQSGDPGVGDVHVGEKFLCFLGGEVDEFFFDASGDDDGFGSVCFGGVVLHFFDERMALRVSGGGTEFVFGNVAGEDGALVREEGELALKEFALVVAELGSDGGFAIVEVWDELFAKGHFGGGFLVVAACFLGARLFPFFEGSDVGEDKLGVDDFDVAGGVDGAEFVNDVVVLEAAHHLHDGIDFTDVGEEFVAEAFAFGGSFNETGDVDELDGGRDQFFGARKLGKNGEAFIGHGHDTHIGIDGAEGVVCGFRFAGAGKGVEEGGLSHVGHSDDSGLKHGWEMREKREKRKAKVKVRNRNVPASLS